MSFIVALQTQKDNPCVLFGKGGGGLRSRHNEVWRFAERPHSWSAEQRGEWPQCKEITSTGGQTAGSAYQQMSFSWGLGLSNEKLQRWTSVPHANIRKVTTCFSKRRIRSEPLYEPKLHLFIQVGESMSNPGFLLFSFFLTEALVSQVELLHVGMFLKEWICAHNRASERFEVDCYHTSLLISPRHAGLVSKKKCFSVSRLATMWYFPPVQNWLFIFQDQKGSHNRINVVFKL